METGSTNTKELAHDLLVRETCFRHPQHCVCGEMCIMTVSTSEGGNICGQHHYAILGHSKSSGAVSVFRAIASPIVGCETLSDERSTDS